MSYRVEAYGHLKAVFLLGIQTKWLNFYRLFLLWPMVESPKTWKAVWSQNIRNWKFKSDLHAYKETSRGRKANFFLKSANRKSANCWIHSAIANQQVSLCFKAVLKVIFVNGFLVQILVRSLCAIFMYSMYICIICRLVEVLSSLITKRLGPQVADPLSATFTEGPQIYKLLSPQICGFFIFGTYLRTAAFGNKAWKWAV